MNTRLCITGDGLCVKRDRSVAHPFRNWGFSFDDDRPLPCLVLIPLLDQPEKHSDHKTVKKKKKKKKKKSILFTLFHYFMCLFCFCGSAL